MVVGFTVFSELKRVVAQLLTTHHINITVAGRSVTEEKLESMLESDDPQVFTQDVRNTVYYVTHGYIMEITTLQLVLITAQKRAALGECEARHQEILVLEQNIRVWHWYIMLVFAATFPFPIPGAS